MRCCSRASIVLICAGVLLLTPALGGGPLAASPVIHFSNDVFAFEPILEGEEVDIVFAFGNVGQEPLIIHDAATSSGCTSADYPSYPVKPCERGTIKTTFHSKGRGGDNHIVLLVKSNDPESPVKTLHIRGRVVKQWQVEPDRFVLTNLNSGGTYHKILRVTNFMDEPLQIAELVSGNPHINLVSKPKKVLPKVEESIAFELRPNDLETGKIVQSSIRVVVSNARMKAVEIPIFLKIK